MFDPLPNSTTPRLAVNEVEVALIERTRAYLRRMRDDLGLQPPLYVMLSLIGVRDIEFLTYNSFSLGRLTVDRDIVQIPEEYIESFDLDPADWYRNIFDALWQSAGYEGSPNYGPEGKRK